MKDGEGQQVLFFLKKLKKKKNEQKKIFVVSRKEEESDLCLNEKKNGRSKQSNKCDQMRLS